jgi:CDP-diacylglycerol--serine O-phosphatidyltransferase
MVAKYEWMECIYFWVVMVLLFSYMMVSEVPMFSLKFANLKLKENYLRFILIIGTLFFVLYLGFAGFAPSILFYILLSIIQNIISKKQGVK